ncbi:hypothetical protein [Caudoviricetes sp.]|nr:hypothetical protein [Caudoviricetes sp.]
MSRTKRKPYTKSKAVDKSCRSHGGCPHCKSNRMARDRRKKSLMDKGAE